MYSIHVIILVQDAEIAEVKSRLSTVDVFGRKNR
nr:MAG TPA: UDP-glucose dehydrogenase [Caudoviricetes sp.]